MVLAIDASALVPPEVPQKRTYEVFSPFEFQAPSGDYYGANVVTGEGPSCLNYSVVFDLRQSGAPSTSIPISANLLGYLGILRTQAGLMFAASHANTASYVVEAYEGTPAGATAAANAAAAYVAAGYGTGDDIRATTVSGGYNAVRVRPTWIQNQLAGAKNLGLNPRHDIVVQLGCNSYPANLAFVNVNGLTRNYAGLNDLCPIGTDPTYYHQISSTIFNTMSGIKADNTGAYSNAKFITGVGIAQGLFGTSSFPPNLRSQKDLTMPIADLMRLYNAPRVVYEEVRQDTGRDGGYATQLYYYNPYPTYPYGSGTQDYPGSVSVSGQLSASSAPIRVSLRFSEPMDSGWGSFVVRLRFSDNTTQNLSGSWSTTVLSNDTWVGTVSPSPFPDGQTTVEVRARKALCGSGLDTNNQELDTTGSGSSGASPSYQTSATFQIDTTGAITGGTNAAGQSLSGSQSGAHCLVARSTQAASGICGIGVASTSGYSSTATFSASTSAAYGPFCSLVGTYTVTSIQCNGLTSSITQFYNPDGTSATSPVELNINGVIRDSARAVSCATMGAGPLSLSAQAAALRNADPCDTQGQYLCGRASFVQGGPCTYGCSGGTIYINFANNVPPASQDLLLKNPDSLNFTITASVPGSFDANVGISPVPTQYLGTVSVPECGVSASTVSDITGVMNVRPPFNATFVADVPPNGLGILAALHQGLNQSVSLWYKYYGSDLVFPSTVPVWFNYQDTGVATDTSTLAIYAFNGTSWSSAPISGQAVTYSSTGFISIQGNILGSGLFSTFFNARDSSAPITTFALQGSSYNFAGTSFVSTYSYVVLTATDPVVNGFASQVAKINYRFDPGLGGPFSVYTTSVPVPLGTHVLQYRSIDYAGNVETVNTATFTVTAGSALKETSDDKVAGALLVGFLGSGANAEAVARAQDNFTLAVSSTNHAAMLNVSNIGNVGVGVAQPASQLDVGPNAVALSLRSGNLTSTGTSVQAALGYNGDVSMRHAIRTFHSTATIGNSMDFLVWTPDTGSTSTVATRDLLALQANNSASMGAMHVNPYGIADKELEVSNGNMTGAGTMQCLQILTPSSRRFKSDISYLGEKDEDRALAETAALKHVRFRYKSRGQDDPGQPEHVGLIYEDAPDSIKDDGPALANTERLANVELALKAAMRKLALLEKRYQKLKAQGKVK